MRGQQPKQNFTFVNLKNPPRFGKEVRRGYPLDITDGAPIFPKPLEYADIDREFKKFVDEKIDLTVGGKDVPTFTLYSNQRFSEYSQEWKYTDENGNLYLNFKTVNRGSDNKNGDNQGGLWNIPGERRYTILQRSVMEDNGTESYEIYSMKQPYAVNLDYRVSFVTDLFENLNTFNEVINDIFKSRQYYIRPNGHYLPLILDDITDDSKYSVGDYRFFVQTAIIKCYAYIIHEDDFKVQKAPKRTGIFMEGVKRRKPKIDIEELDDAEHKHQSIDVTINFEERDDKVEFDFDTDMKVEEIQKTNIRSIRLFVNGTPTFYEKGFTLKDGDHVKVRITPFDYNEKVKLVLKGYNPNYTYDDNLTPVRVSDEPIKSQSIEIE